MLEHDEASADADGWLCVGWLYDGDRNESYDVWWNPETDEGRLRRKAGG